MLLIMVFLLAFLFTLNTILLNSESEVDFSVTLGDIILAEPGALIGFAGPRVIKQTIGEDLPEGFQRAEFLKDKGFIDHIVSRSEMKEKVTKFITLLSK